MYEVSVLFSVHDSRQKIILITPQDTVAAVLQFIEIYILESRIWSTMTALSFEMASEHVVWVLSMFFDLCLRYIINLEL